MKALLIIILLLALVYWLAGCETPEPEPQEYNMNERFEFSPEYKATIMQLIQMKIDPNLMPNKSWSRKNPY